MKMNINIFKRQVQVPKEGEIYKIKLPKGFLPSYISLSPYKRIAYRLFKKYAEKNRNLGKLEDDLLKAHILIRPVEYVSYVYLTTVLSSIPFILFLILSLFLGNFLFTFFSLIGLILAPSMTYMLLINNPSSVAKTRGRKIDGKLPQTMNFIAALASADVNVDVIFKELAKRPEYGEVAKEAEWITRDTELLGKDILTALRDAAKRSPSSKWSDFLQGVVTTSTSGGRLKPYFIAKGEEFENELKLQMKRIMETLSIFAESFVTVGVAFPLFLIIIVGIMAIITPNSSLSMLLLYFVVFMMLPVLIGVFAWIIKSTSEVVT